MRGRKLSYLLMIMTLLWVNLLNSALARPKLSDQLGPTRPVPPAAERVTYAQEAVNANVALTPQNLIREPRMFVDFLKSNPDRLSVAQMKEPALALTLSRILLEGKAIFLAEKLLFMACEKWPDRSDIKREHGRILIQLGRTAYAVKSLSEAVAKEPNQAENHFLYAFGLVRLKPQTEERKRLAIEHFEAVLKLNPNYRDASGWTASNIKNQLDRMKAERLEEKTTAQ